jgi:hypothetical protein
MDSIHPHIAALHKDGCKHRDKLLRIVDAWPIGEYSKMIAYKSVDGVFRESLNNSITDIKRWVATIWKAVLADSVYDKPYVTNIMRGLEERIKEAEYLDTLKSDINEVMDHALSVLISVPSPAISDSYTFQTHGTHIPNTAFIMMWIDPNHPELEDVWDAIEEVCGDFGIKADRADKVEHQGTITDLVLRRIAESEFLIADLTGERPNVYYEIGYAHALNKRPILFRKHSTRLHFDLSVHNVPEYKNGVELKKLLNARLEAILGRKAKPRRRPK